MCPVQIHYSFLNKDKYNSLHRSSKVEGRNDFTMTMVAIKSMNNH